MKPNHVLVFGGTSEALAICQALHQHQIHYTLSVATAAGEQAAISFSKQVATRLILGRMGVSEMRNWIVNYGVDCVIDAAHPYAEVLRQTILVVCVPIECPVIRYERGSQIDQFDHPLVQRAPNLEKACQLVTEKQQKVLLTTGSKDLAQYRQRLSDKQLYVRVLPTSKVLAQCEALGFGLEQIIAMKGPFSQVMNLALYQTLAPDVVITKESGDAGGFSEKVQPCIALGITCIVIARPSNGLANNYTALISSIEECRALFAHWQQTEQRA